MASDENGLSLDEQKYLDFALTAAAKCDYGHGNQCACTKCFTQFQIAKRHVMQAYGLTRDHQIHGYAVEAIKKRMEGPALPPLPATPPLGELMTMIRQAVRHEVRSLLMEYKVDKVMADLAVPRTYVRQADLQGSTPMMDAMKAAYPAKMVTDLAAWQTQIAKAAKNVIVTQGGVADGKCVCPVDVVINTGCKCGGK